MSANEWGARIERGEINESRGTTHRVKSLDREGIVTPFIGGLDIAQTVGEYTPTEYAVGDMVYFFVFADGHGAILGKAK